MAHFAFMMRTRLKFGVLSGQPRSRWGGEVRISAGLDSRCPNAGCDPHVKTSGKSFYIPVPQIATSSVENTPWVFSFPSDPFRHGRYARGPRPVFVSPRGYHTRRKVAVRNPVALTSAGPASSADPERRGALPADGGGLQHSLHVLVLRSVLGVLQPLGLALAWGGVAGELAGLREGKNKDLLF